MKHPDGDALTADQYERFKDRVRGFENAWKRFEQDGGPEPVLEHHLPGDEPVRRAVLLELAVLDLEKRLRRGDHGVSAGRYWERFPDLRQPRAAEYLLGREYEILRDSGKDVTPDDFAGRYPGQDRERLRMLLADLDANRTAEAAERTPPGGSGAAANGAPPPGQSTPIGKYVVVGRLGEGGQGDVFLAYDPDLGRQVAIKWAREPLAEDPRARARQLAEGRILASVQDPGVAQVYEVGEQQGRMYLVFENLEGCSLDKYLRQSGPLPARQAVALTAEVAAIVGRLQGKVVVHRDLKPGNIMVKPCGGRLQPRLIDFGMASRMQVWGDINPPGEEVCGTLPYMAPEQARGEAGVGARSDVYSLGAVLYELLTGRRIYRSPAKPGEPSLWEQAKRGDVRPPRELNRGVPASLDRICRKALNKDPAGRYRDATEFANALRWWLRRRYLWAAGSACALLVAGLCLLLWPSRPERPGPAAPGPGALAVRPGTAAPAPDVSQDKPAKPQGKPAKEEVVKPPVPLGPPFFRADFTDPETRYYPRLSSNDSATVSRDLRLPQPGELRVVVKRPHAGIQLWRDFEIHNFAAEVKVRPAGRVRDGSFSLLFRSQGYGRKYRGSGYRLEVEPARGGVALFKGVSKRWGLLGQWARFPTAGAAPATKHVWLVAEGPRFRAFVNRRLVLDVSDTALPATGAGAVGLMTSPGNALLACSLVNPARTRDMVYLRGGLALEVNARAEPGWEVVFSRFNVYALAPVTSGED